MDDDTEMLVLAGRVRAVEERLDELDEPIRDIQQKLDILLQDAAERPRNFHWPDLEPEDAQKRWIALLEWTQKVLCARYPSASRALRSCWWQHPDAVDSLTAAWLTWTAAYRNGQAVATDTGNWHRVYLPALREQLDAALSSCTRGRHEPDESPAVALNSVPTLVTSALSSRR